MKKLIAMLFLVSTTAHADIVVMGNNKMIKECLDVYGFDKTLPVEQRLNTFDWRSASGCVSNFVVGKQQKKVAEQREFLDQNPWFKGKNWKWIERAEYTCRHIDTLQGSYEVCSKPIYLN